MSSTRETIERRHSPAPYAAVLGLAVLAIVSILPLLFEARPISFLQPWTTAFGEWGSKGLVIVALGLVILIAGWLHRHDEPRAGKLVFRFAVLAGLLTAVHWLMVDGQNEAWQRQLYLDILNHAEESLGQLRVPHQFRPLPYGLVRTLEGLTHDWLFACVAYRWFFMFWFLWLSYRFARIFHDVPGALLTLVVLPLYYPLSVQYYLGQLTDPLSHALFVLALICVVQDRWVTLAAALALGVLAKETAVLLVPVYWTCYWRRGWFTLAKTLVLGTACVAAFLAARLPLGWRPGNEDLNGLSGLMIGTNLGIGEPLATTTVPLAMNYLHPALFILPFLPMIFLRWRSLDPRLRVIFLTFTPLLLFSNLCYGWLYESRNYVPLLPLLTTMALPAKPRPTAPA